MTFFKISETAGESYLSAFPFITLASHSIVISVITPNHPHASLSSYVKLFFLHYINSFLIASWCYVRVWRLM